MDSKTPTTTLYRGLGLPPALRTPSFGVPGGPAVHRYQPASSLHAPEDLLVLEIGSRLLRAGFANEASPRCQLAWNDSVRWRSGDRIVSALVGRRQGGSAIWDLNFALRGESGESVDKLLRRQLGLVQDLVERGLRLAYNKHLLLDSKTRRILLPVPPLFPTRILSAILATIFVHFHPPAVTLMSAPVLATVAAGLRSALVVDVGWAETVVTPVYDLRAVEGRGLGVHGRSIRGTRRLRDTWLAFLARLLRDASDPPDVSEVEEIMERLSYVPSSRKRADDDRLTVVPLGRRTLRIPFSQLAEPVESAFFAPTTTPSVTPDIADDDDTPLPLLLYHALLHCTIDVRSACVSRIVFVGGGARIPGLQARILRDLQAIIDECGWGLGPRASDTSPFPKHCARTRHPDEDKEDEDEPVPRELAEGRADVLVRGVRSLGVWAGGSLVAGLKVKAAIEIEREKFLSEIAKGMSGLPPNW